MTRPHEMESRLCWCDPQVFCICQACCIGKDPADADPDCGVCEGTGAQEAAVGDPPPYSLVHYTSAELDEAEVVGASGPLSVWPWS